MQQYQNFPFFVDSCYGLRSDSPNTIEYCVFLGFFPQAHRYILSYEGDSLKEVYFTERFTNYFMSCRTDFKTISHYYTSKPYIKRYENGVCNRIYTFKSKGTVVCSVNGVMRKYTTHNRQKPLTDDFVKKLYLDLTNFLATFNNLGLNRFFLPTEPA